MVQGVFPRITDGRAACCTASIRRRITISRSGATHSANCAIIEIHVATPLNTCEARDRKGLYAKARAGILKEFTGVSDLYEAPEHPDLVIDTRDCTVGEAAQRILLKLENLGFICGRSWFRGD